MAKVLLYNLGEGTEKGKKLRQVLKNLSFKAVTVDPAQLGETVGYLAGLDGFAPAGAPYGGGACDTEFLLLCGDERQLDRLLAAMRRVGVSVAHKALLTASNAQWTLGKLIGEIEREHAAMTRAAMRRAAPLAAREPVKLPWEK